MQVKKLHQLLIQGILFTDIDFLTPGNNESLTYDYLIVGDDTIANNIACWIGE